MANPDQVQDESLRSQLKRAHEQMRTGDASSAVRTLADAYLYILTAKPEMLDQTIEMRPGRSMPIVMRWPALGANLSLQSVQAKSPKIEFVRERFSVSEAITYYEYTLESAIAQKL